MEQEDNFPISDISLPDPSVMTATHFAPSQFTTLLKSAQAKRKDADTKWDALVAMLIDEFSKQASMITKLKMEGQINTPVANQLLTNIPDGISNHCGGNGEAGFERQELNQLMSLEAQLSPVQKLMRDKNSSLTAMNNKLMNLSQSNMTTSQMTPPMSITQREESRGSSSQEDEENIDVHSSGQSDEHQSETQSSQSPSSEQSTEFEQVERVNDDDTEPSQTEPSQTEPSYTETSFVRTSMSSSKIEKVSVLQETQNQQTPNTAEDHLQLPQMLQLGQQKITPVKLKKQDNDNTEPTGDELMREMRRHKRQISLSEQPDENKKDLEPEVSQTPNMRHNSRKASSHLFVSVSGDKPSREPPLTSKQKPSFRRKLQQGTTDEQKQQQSEKSGQTSAFRIQIQSTHSPKTESSFGSSDQIEAIITGKNNQKTLFSGGMQAPKPFNLQPLRLSNLTQKQQDQKQAEDDAEKEKSELLHYHVVNNPFPLQRSNTGANSSRNDRRGTLQTNLQSNSQFTSSNHSKNASINSFRRLTTVPMPLTVRNLLSKSNNQEEFDQKEAGHLALTTNVSLTESKLIIALKKQLLEAKSLLERDHHVKMRLIEGARDLKRQLVQSLKQQNRLNNTITNKRNSEVSNALMPSNSLNRLDQQLNANQSQEERSSAERMRATMGQEQDECESPFIKVHMKVSSSTQTEDQVVMITAIIPAPPAPASNVAVVIDADSGGSSVKPAAATTTMASPVRQHNEQQSSTSSAVEEGTAWQLPTEIHTETSATNIKADAQAQTEEEYPSDTLSHYDHQKVEIEMHKLMENHEIESSRLRGNIDFWKGKVDALIKSQKEMLEGKTKLHVELEHSDQQLQDAQAQVKELSEEIDAMQRQLTRQTYNITAAGSHDSYMSSKDISLLDDQHSNNLNTVRTTTKQTAIGAPHPPQHYKKDKTSSAAITSRQFTKSAAKDSGRNNRNITYQQSMDINQVGEDTQEQMMQVFGPVVDSSVVSRQQARNTKMTSLPSKYPNNNNMNNNNSAAQFSSKMSNTELAKQYEQSQSPVKQAARRAVIKKGQNLAAQMQQKPVQKVTNADRFTNAPRFASPDNFSQQQQSVQMRGQAQGVKAANVQTGDMTARPPLQIRKDSSSEKKKHQKNQNSVYSTLGSKSPNTQQHETANIPIYNKLARKSGQPQAVKMIPRNKQLYVPGNTMTNNASSQLFGNQQAQASSTGSRNGKPKSAIPGAGQKSLPASSQQIMTQQNNTANNLSNSQTNYQTSSQPARQLLTTQDKFSMFTQKHVKQAKKQESDQKAQRDMMVQLIRDRLLQKNTTQSSQNNSTSANAINTSKSSGAGNTSQSNQNDASMLNQSKSGRSGRKIRQQNNNDQYGPEATDERQMQLLEELKYNRMTNESMEDNILIDEENSFFNPQYQQVLQNNNNTTISIEMRRNSAMAIDPTPQHQILMNGATGTTESNFSQQQQVQQSNVNSDLSPGASRILNAFRSTNNNNKVENFIALTQQNSSLERTQELITKSKQQSQNGGRNGGVTLKKQDSMGLSNNRNAGAGGQSARSKFITQGQQIQQSLTVQPPQSTGSSLTNNVARLSGSSTAAGQQAIPGRIHSVNQNAVNTSTVISANSSQAVRELQQQSKLQLKNNSSSQNFQSRLRAPSKNAILRDSDEPLSNKETSALQPSESDAMLKRYI